MTKHTPGPWKAYRESATLYEIRSPDMTRIGEVFLVDNADLFAAAPELLEALKAALGHGLDEGESFGHDYHSAGAPSAREKRAAKVADQMRAAIRKAEGTEA